MSLRLRKESITLSRIAFYAVIIWLVLSLGLALANKNEENNDMTLTSPKNFIIIKNSISEVYKYSQNKEPTLLYFAQENCEGCKIIEPAITKLSEERQDIKIVKIYLDYLFYKDMEGTFKLMNDFQVPGTPTLILIENGKEIARKIGIFNTRDQYKGLTSFIENALGNQKIEITENKTRTQYFTAPLAFLLGIIAAFSPCSIPMITTYSTLKNEKRTSVLSTFAVLLGITGFAGLGLFFLSTWSIGYIGINIYPYLLLYLGAFIAAWGILSVMGKEPIIKQSQKIKTFLPAIGLQCSLPFLLTAISIGSLSPERAVIAAISFTIGYVLPYIGLSQAINRLILYLRQINRYNMYLRLQGIIMIIAATYLIYQAYLL